MASMIEWVESDLLQNIRYAMDIHFAIQIVLWLWKHRVAYRRVPVTIFAWALLVYWVGLGIIGGFMLYRPDQELAAALRDDLQQIPAMTMGILGFIFMCMMTFNIYYHI